MLGIMFLYRDGREGQSQSFDPREIGRMLKKNVTAYLNLYYYQGKKSKSAP